MVDMVVTSSLPKAAAIIAKGAFGLPLIIAVGHFAFCFSTIT